MNGYGRMPDYGPHSFIPSPRARADGGGSGCNNGCVRSDG
jgi:hypothetical protein